MCALQIAFKSSVSLKESPQPLGTADWATAPGDGLRRHERGDVLLGYGANGDPIGSFGNRHGLVVAGTRSGKGAAFLVPNLLLWPGSMVVLDPKGENAIVTARRRGQGSRYCKGLGQSVRILDPFGEVETPEDDFSDVAATYNPLDLIDPRDEGAVDTAGRIADALVASENSSDPFFDESARDLIQKVILHVASASEYAGRRNLVTVRTLLTAGDQEAKALARTMTAENVPSGMALLFAMMRANPAFGGIVANAGAMYQALNEGSERTFASILAVANANLGFLDSPPMRRCVSRSTFRLSDLKTSPRRLSLYLCLPQRYADVHFRWLRMMIALTITEMERVRQRSACGHPVLMLLDEFAALKRMRVIENAAAQIAGFHVRMVFVLQSLAQAKQVYRDNWETLAASASFKLFFCNDDHFTRDYASKLIGEREVVRMVASTSEARGETWGSSASATFGTSESRSESATFGPVQQTSTTHGRSVGASYSHSQSSSSGGSRSQTTGISQTLHKRALVTPDEVGRIFGGVDGSYLLALTSGSQPMMLKRIRYFAQGWMRGWYDWHPDHARPLTLNALDGVITQELQAAAAAERRHAQDKALKKAREQQKALEDVRAAEASRLEQSRLREWREEQDERRQRRRLPMVKLAVGAFGLFWASAFVTQFVRRTFDI